MNVFGNMRDRLLSYFDTNDEVSSDWININDGYSKWTIKDFPYNLGVDENLTRPHCWRCVTVNQCWFKNEKGKKPEEFDYSNYTYGQISKSKRGLYHPYCHCKKRAINVPKLKDITVLLVRPKFNDFFKRKKRIFYGLGYTYKDEEYIINLYIDKIKNSYRSGNYSIYKHCKYGFQINIAVSLVGKNKFENRTHEFKTGLFIYPNGKLRIVTVFAGEEL